MAIEEIDAYRYKGQIFTSEKDAIKYAENLVADFIKNRAIEKNLSARDFIKLTEIVLEHRMQLIDLLEY